MEDFRRPLEDCQLEDIGFSRTWFTWERGQIMERNIRERIDRRVATNAWLQLFPTYSLRHLSHFFLNHYPLLIETMAEGMGKKPIRFHFEAWWALEESCKE